MKSLHVAAIFALLSVCSIASAQPYPARPITMVVPFAAGGPVDTVAHSGRTNEKGARPNGVSG